MFFLFRPCDLAHYTAIHYTTLHCMWYAALHCSALHCTCTALHCIILLCTALHCSLNSLPQWPGLFFVARRSVFGQIGLCAGPVLYSTLHLSRTIKLDISGFFHLKYLIWFQLRSVFGGRWVRHCNLVARSHTWQRDLKYCTKPM